MTHADTHNENVRRQIHSAAVQNTELILLILFKLEQS